MRDLVPDGTELLGGLEMGGIPIATVLSAETGLPALFVRKEAKTYGTCKLAEGPDVEGRRVTLVEDVITTGGAVRDATHKLREYGATVEHVLCAIDRSPAGENPLADVDLEVRPVLTKAELDAVPRLSRQVDVDGPGCRGRADRRGRGPRPRRRCRWCRHHSQTIGITENARITMIALSMFSPEARERRAEEVAEQRDAEDPQHRTDGAPHEEPARAPSGSRRPPR